MGRRRSASLSLREDSGRRRRRGREADKIQWRRGKTTAIFRNGISHLSTEISTCQTQNQGQNNAISHIRIPITHPSFPYQMHQFHFSSQLHPQIKRSGGVKLNNSLQIYQKQQQRSPFRFLFTLKFLISFIRVKRDGILHKMFHV